MEATHSLEYFVTNNFNKRSSSRTVLKKIQEAKKQLKYICARQFLPLILVLEK